MSDQPQADWGDLESLSTKTDKPKWPYCCGGCCLLVVVGMLAFVFMTVSSMKRLQDSEKSWPALARRSIRFYQLSFTRIYSAAHLGPMAVSIRGTTW